MIMFLNGFKALCKMGLTGLQWNVLNTMLCSVEHDNVIKLKQKHIADELQIAPTRVSEAVKVFKQKGIIAEANDAVHGKVYIFNPQFGHTDKSIKKADKRFQNKAVQKIKGLPKSLGSAVKALAVDNEFLQAGGVFPKELIDLWIANKRNDLKKHVAMPTPMEYEMYYDL